jgi:hypothetical protein
MKHSRNFACIFCRCVVFRIKREEITRLWAEVVSWPITLAPFDHHNQPTSLAWIFGFGVLQGSSAGGVFHVK